MKKTERGFYDCSTDTRGNAVVVWHDTAIVTCASNYAGAEPESFITRWSKAEKKKINVPMPHALMLYNQKMGGVDLFDQFVATYRARIRSKKWWWPFFAWSLNAAMTNAWLLYKNSRQKYSNAGIYEGNSRHNACFIQAKKVVYFAIWSASAGKLTYR